MRIAVFLKPVLDAECPFVMTDEAYTLESFFIPTIVDPADLHVLSMIRAAYPVGTAEIVAVCIEPGASDEVVRKGVAYGADRALVVRDKTYEAPVDYYARGNVASAVMKHLDADIVACGLLDANYVLDGMGSCIAETMKTAQISGVTAVESREGDSYVTVQRKLDHGDREILTCSLPAVLVSDGSRDSLPYPAFPYVLKAQNIQVEEVTLEILNVSPNDTRGIDALKQECFLPPRPRTKRSSEGKKSGASMMASMMGGGSQKKSSNLIEEPADKAALRIIDFLEEKDFLD